MVERRANEAEADRLSVRRAWARFGRAESTFGPTPGVREAWHRGRRWYHVWVLALDGDVVGERIARVREALGDDVVPFASLTPHVTVWVHGFLEEEAGGPVVRPAPVVSWAEPVAIAVGGVNSFASCPFLEVRGAAIPRVRAGFGGVEERWAAYVPHLTVGRYAGSLPVAPLVRALRPLRSLPTLHTVATLVHGVVDAWSEAGDVTPA